MKFHGFHDSDALCAIARVQNQIYNILCANASVRIFSMEQHPVPQNVTTFQFRLVGDMTIKQFGYLAGGIILAYISYKLPLPFFFTWPLAITSAVGGFGLAFVPIEERPMDVWIMSFFKNVYSPTQYVWQKLKHTRAVPHATPPPGDQGGVALPASTPTPTATTASTTTTRIAPLRPRSIVGEATLWLARLFAPGQKNPAAGVPTPTTAPPTVKTQAVGAPGIPTVQQAQSAAISGIKKPTFIQTMFLEIQRVFSKTPSFSPYHETQQKRGAVLTATRTAHSPGLLAWITGLVQSPGRPRTIEPESIFANAPTSSVTGKRPEPAPQTQAQPQGAQPGAAAAQVASRALGGQVEKLQKELADTTTLTRKRLVELQEQLTQTLAQREKLESELTLLRQKLDHATVLHGPTQTATVVPPGPPSATTVRVIAAEGAVRAGLPRLTTFPNVVTGIVKDYNGNLLPGVLVTVRDKNDIPLRALKTNKLGQFAASTPLPNGTYIVEIEDPKNSYTFDRAQIALAGEIAPAIEVMAKSQKQIERDRLAREIFGNQQNEFTMTKPQ